MVVMPRADDRRRPGQMNFLFSISGAPSRTALDGPLVHTVHRRGTSVRSLSSFVEAMDVYERMLSTIEGGVSTIGRRFCTSWPSFTRLL